VEGKGLEERGRKGKKHGRERNGVKREAFPIPQTKIYHYTAAF